MHKRKANGPGFTIVELLIVIVVIAILATISIIAYNGVQARARDSHRQSDIAALTKALELYYIDNGKYPAGGPSTSMTSSPNWSTTADASWDRITTALKPYTNKALSDPISTPDVDVRSTGFDYAYFSDPGGVYCGTGGTYQMYILIYRLEGSSQRNTFSGNCSVNALSYGGLSNYRVAKN